MKSVYIPGGLSKAHPGLEQAFKSVQALFAEQQQLIQANSASNFAAQIAALASEIATIESEIATIDSIVNPTYTAVSSVSFGRPVYEVTSGTAAVIDGTSPGAVGAVLGVAGANASVGRSFPVIAPYRVAGGVGSGWDVGVPVFVGPSGALSQIPPDVLRPLIIGYALTSADLFVRPEQYNVPYTLNQVPAGDIAFIPGPHNLIVVGALGLTLDGGLVLNGGAIIV